MRGAADTRDREELDGAREDVGVGGHARGGDQQLLFLHLRVDVVQLTGGLQVTVAEAAQRLIGLSELALGHEPSDHLLALERRVEDEIYLGDSGQK